MICDFPLVNPITVDNEYLTIDSSGNYILPDYLNHKLYKVTPDGVWSRIYYFSKGTGPVAVRIDSAGNYIVCETEADILSKITPNGARTIVYRFPQETHPFGLAIDSSGNYIVLERVKGSDPILSKIAPSGARTVIASVGNAIGVVCTTAKSKPGPTEGPIGNILLGILAIVVVIAGFLIYFIKYRK